MKNLIRETGVSGAVRRGVLTGVVAAAVSGVAAVNASNHFPEPSWASGAMFLSHEFPTNSPTPAPDQFVHPEGATLMLSEVFVGSSGIGWQDPADYPAATARVDSGGAWDLGRGEPDSDGRIEISFRLSEIEDPGSFLGFEVELFVNVVRYAGGGIPTFSADGYNPTNTTIADGFFDFREPFDVWNLTTWQGTITGIMEESMTLVVNAHPSQGTVVDTVQVWANVTAIPEPRVYAAIFGLIALVLATIRRVRRPGG